MRHHNTKRKFGRDKNQRKALVSSLALNLIVRGKIKTTEPKAKKGDMATRRVIISKLSNRSKEVKKLFEIIAPKYIDKKGGYTRILKLGARKSDGSKMAIIEFI